MRKTINKTSFDIALDYHALPNLNHHEVILIDPMLATGKSMVKTAQVLTEMYPKIERFFIVALIASQQGVDCKGASIT